MATTLDSYINRAARDLPTMPAVATQIIKAIDDDDSSVDDVRALVEQDQALAGRILRVSNLSTAFPASISNRYTDIFIIWVHSSGRDRVLNIRTTKTWSRQKLFLGLHLIDPSTQ